MKRAKALNRTRSFPCPDDLWTEVESFAAERGLGSPAAAVRLLLRSGLVVEARMREIEAARDWQIEQAWSDVTSIAAGDRQFSSWNELITQADAARQTAQDRRVVGHGIAENG
jgi:hypothetical protein